MLKIFYDTVVASALLFIVVRWGSRLRVADANILNKLIRKINGVVGEEVDSMTVVSDRRILIKLHVILDNITHSLHVVLTLTKHRSTFSTKYRPQSAAVSNFCFWPSNHTIPPSKYQ